MLRLYSTLATGGFGFSTALDAAVNGYWPTATVFGLASLVLLGFGYLELRAATARKDEADILRGNINDLIKMNAKRSAEAATFMHALFELRDALRSAMGREGMIEIIEDSLAEVSDPASGASFCLDLLNTMGVPLYPFVKARHGSNVRQGSGMSTLVRLPISQLAFSEIALKLRAAGYDHCFLANGEIAMDGIAVEPDPYTLMPPRIVEVDPRDISRDRFREIYGLDNLGNDNSEA